MPTPRRWCRECGASPGGSSATLPPTWPSRTRSHDSSPASHARNSLAELHTIGYEKRSIEEFLDALQDAGIDTLVDVRDVAFSHKPGFSGGALRDALGRRGIDYVHAQFAG